MKPIIVIPTYNERVNIIVLLHKIFALKIPSLEVIVVDDNSPDGTAGVVEKMAQEFKIHIIKRLRKLGLGSAYVAGFKKSLALGAEVIFEMDADLSHDPNDLPRMMAEIENNNVDLVIGSRKIKGGKIIGWNLWRKFISTGAMLFSRIILGLKTKDVTAGFRCFKKIVLETIDIDAIKSNGYAFQEELLYRTEREGFIIKEIPVIFTDRTEGKSKLGKKDIVEFFGTIFRLRFKK